MEKPEEKEVKKVHVKLYGKSIRRFSVNVGVPLREFSLRLVKEFEEFPNGNIFLIVPEKGNFDVRSPRNKFELISDDLKWQKILVENCGKMIKLHHFERKDHKKEEERKKERIETEKREKVLEEKFQTFLKSLKFEEGEKSGKEVGKWHGKMIRKFVFRVGGLEKFLKLLKEVFSEETWEKEKKEGSWGNHHHHQHKHKFNHRGRGRGRGRGSSVHHGGWGHSWFNPQHWKNMYQNFQSMYHENMKCMKKGTKKDATTEEQVEKNFEVELKRLKEMGFCDKPKNIKLLKQFSGSLESVIAQLFSSKE